MSPIDGTPPPTPPAFSVEAKFEQMDASAIAQLRRDVSRIYTVTDRTEDRVAVLCGRMANVEQLLARQMKLLVDIAEKLGVGL